MLLPLVSRISLFGKTESTKQKSGKAIFAEAYREQVIPLFEELIEE